MEIYDENFDNLKQRIQKLIGSKKILKKKKKQLQLQNKALEENVKDLEMTL
jgi:hypothetical protein